MVKVLTDQQIGKLKAGDHYDPITPGLFIRVGVRAGGTWNFKRRVCDKRFHNNLGKWPAIGVKAARAAVEKIRRDHDDPIVEQERGELARQIKIEEGKRAMALDRMRRETEMRDQRRHLAELRKQNAVEDSRGNADGRRSGVPRLGAIYLMATEAAGVFKIGKALNVHVRSKQHGLRLIGHCMAEDYSSAERIVLKRLKPYRISRTCEYFRCPENHAIDAIETTTCSKFIYAAPAGLLEAAE